MCKAIALFGAGKQGKLKPVNTPPAVLPYFSNCDMNITWKRRYSHKRYIRKELNMTNQPLIVKVEIKFTETKMGWTSVRGIFCLYLITTTVKLNRISELNY